MTRPPQPSPEAVEAARAFLMWKWGEAREEEVGELAPAFDAFRTARAIDATALDDEAAEIEARIFVLNGKRPGYVARLAAGLARSTPPRATGDATGEIAESRRVLVDLKAVVEAFTGKPSTSHGLDCMTVIDARRRAALESLATALTNIGHPENRNRGVEAVTEVAVCGIHRAMAFLGGVGATRAYDTHPAPAAGVEDQVRKAAEVAALAAIPRTENRLKGDTAMSSGVVALIKAEAVEAAMAAWRKR